VDSRLARRLFAENASAMAYVEVEGKGKDRGTKGIGSAFHVGEGIFVTARHVVEGKEITEIKITEHVRIDTREYLQEIFMGHVEDEFIQEYEKKVRGNSEQPVLWKHFLKPLNLAEGPFFNHNEPNLDVAIFKVRDIHPAGGIIKLGIHWDDWVPRGLWHLADAIVLGYPPIPMVNEPRLIAAKAEINTFVVPRHAQAIHFLLSAIPRGGFSGGLALLENGDALGLVTQSFTQNNLPEQTGFFAVLSVEAIVSCLGVNKCYPEVQRKYHQSKLGIDPKPIFESFTNNKPEAS
jgi:hypothetical protein